MTVVLLAIFMRSDKVRYWAIELEAPEILRWPASLVSMNDVADVSIDIPATVSFDANESTLIVLREVRESTGDAAVFPGSSAVVRMNRPPRRSLHIVKGRVYGWTLWN
jgi:hypothetical protein